MSNPTLTVFNVTVYCEDEDGSRDILGQGFFPADDALSAHNLARDEFWDERLTGDYLCTFRSEVVDHPCWYCLKREAPGECDHCGIDVCEECHSENLCCDGG